MASKDLEFPDKFAKSESDSTNGNQDEFVLEQVLGLTSSSAHALGLNSVNGNVAYPAACMLVLMDPKTNEQKFVESPSLRYISSVSFSEDGKYLAFGEHGIKPYVMVWLTKEHREFNRFVVDNSVGIKAIQFHPKSLFMVILGCNDLTIGVWDFVRGRRLALTKWQTSPLSLTIPRPGSYVVVCGHRKVTLFKIDSVQSNTHETNVFQDRKAVLLGRQSEYTFVDITSGRNKHEREVYTVTSCGFLCEIKMGDIIIDKAVKVDTHAYCVRFGVGHIFVGCSNGAVKICSPESLTVEASVSINSLLGSDSMIKIGVRRFPDTAAMVVNERDAIVTCIYTDYTVHSWQFNQEGDKMVCSAIVPVSKNSRKGGSYESCIKEQFKRESLLRSFLGFGDRVKGSKMHDMPNANEMFGVHHGNYVKVTRTRFQHANAIKFSPDGKEVVCGNEEGEIKVYDAATGVLRRVIEAHSSHVTCIDLMYDDTYKLVCSGGRDRIIFVLNAKMDFSLVQVLCDHSAAITAISLAHNSGFLTLVSAAADNVILIRRSIPGKTLKFTITGEIAEASHNKSFNLTSEYIVTGSGNSGIKLWKADPVFSGKPTKTIKCDQKGSATSRAIGIDPSGSFLAVTQLPGQITVYHLQTGQAVGSLTSQSDVTSVRFTNDLRYMISSTSNGCALVWRLPERMTEFMRAKQERVYQIEVSRDMSCEDYASSFQRSITSSCDHTPKMNDTDSMSSEYRDDDITPSIESLSLMKLCPELGESSRGDVTVTSSVSSLSCSTCHESCSDTVFSMQTSGSSSFVKTKPIRIPAIPGHNIEESTCTRLGMFKYVSPTEGNGLPDMFTYKSKTVKTPPKSAGDSAQRDAVVNFSKNNRKVGSKQSKSATLLGEPSSTDDIETSVRSKFSIKHTNYSSSLGRISPSNTKINLPRIKTLPWTSPTKSTRKSNSDSVHSETTTCATSDSSGAKDYSSVCCASVLTSSEAEHLHSFSSCTTSQCPYCTDSNHTTAGKDEARLASKEQVATVSNDNKTTCGNKTAQNGSDVQIKDCEEKAPNLEACVEPVNVGFSAKFESTEDFKKHSDVYHDVMGSLREEEPAILIKADEKLLTDKQTEGICDEIAHCICTEENIDNSDHKGDIVSDVIVSEEIEPLHRIDEMADQAKVEDTMTAEQKLADEDLMVADNAHCSPRLSEEGLCSDKSNTVDTDPEKKKIGVVMETEIVPNTDKSYTQLANIQNEYMSNYKSSNCATEVKNKSPFYDSTEDGTVFNYHSITRDAQGRLRWVGRSTTNSSTTTADRSPMNPLESQAPQSTPPNCSLNSPWNIKCSRCTTKTGLYQSSPDRSTVSLDPGELYSPDSGKESFCGGHHYLEEGGFLGTDQLKLIQVASPCDDQKNTSDACDILMNASEYLENRTNVSGQYVRDLLHKWQDELKECLQLSNSQETFHRLYSDMDDAELVELLTLALESKPGTASPEFLHKWQKFENEERPRSAEDASDLSNIQSPLEAGAETPQSSSLSKLLKLLKMNEDGSRGKLDPQKNESPSMLELVYFLERAVNEKRMLGGSPPKPIRKQCESKARNAETVPPNVGCRYVASQTSPIQQGYETSYVDGAVNRLARMYAHRGDVVEELGAGLEGRKAREVGLSRLELGASHSLFDDLNERTRRDDKELGTIQRPSSERLAKNSPGSLLHSLDSSHKSNCALKTESEMTSLTSNCDSISKEIIGRSAPRVHSEDFSALIRSRARDMPAFDSGESCMSLSTRLSTEPVLKTSRQSIVDVFQDQDEYLKKLKEVRAKFEESIRALSNERKFRISKTESTG